LTETSIDKKDVSQSLHSIMERAVDRNMTDIFLSSIFKVLCQINKLPIWLKIIIGHIFNPSWDSGRKKKELWSDFALFFDVNQNLINIFLKTKVKHGISFIKNESFKTAELDVSSFNMILYSTGGSYEDINASS
jgi:hypothetical protein